MLCDAGLPNSGAISSSVSALPRAAFVHRAARLARQRPRDPGPPAPPTATGAASAESGTERRVGRGNGRHRLRRVEAQHLARIDPVRIFDHAGVQPVDVGPEERIVAIVAGEIPERVALAHGVGLRAQAPAPTRRAVGRRARGRARPAKSSGTNAASGSPSDGADSMEMGLRTRNTVQGVQAQFRRQ